MNAKNKAEQLKKFKSISGLKNGESYGRYKSGVTDFGSENCGNGTVCEACAATQVENGELENACFSNNEYAGFKKTLRQINDDFSKELAENFSVENNEICALPKEDDISIDCDLTTEGDSRPEGILPAEGDLSAFEKIQSVEQALPRPSAPPLETEPKNKLDSDIISADITENVGELNILGETAAEKTNAAVESNFAHNTSRINGGATGGADVVVGSAGAACEVGKVGEISDSEIENERYRSEFNEFRYARYMGFVIADMRKVYGAGKITAALSDFEREKPYAYEFTTRGLGIAGSYIKSVRKSLKKSRGAQKSVAVAAADDACNAETCNAANSENAYNASGKRAKKSYALPRACAVIGGDGADSALLITLKEIRLAKKLGASEITVFVSPSLASSGNKKAIKSEIKALKRACFNKIFKLGVNLGELTQLQAENVISVAAALKIKSFTLYGNGAFFKLKRLKSLAPNARFEVYSQVNSARALSELIEGGADKIHTPHLTELSRSVREAFKNVSLRRIEPIKF